MKKCEYCAKEISYYDMYCDDQCQMNANKFYEHREKYTKLFSVLNGIFVLSIGIGIFAFAFLRTLGAVMVTMSLLVLGVLYFLCPFPPEIMIHKYQLKKSIFITKIIAIVLFTLGIISLFLTIFVL